MKTSQGSNEEKPGQPPYPQGGVPPYPQGGPAPQYMQGGPAPYPQGGAPPYPQNGPGQQYMQGGPPTPPVGPSRGRQPVQPQPQDSHIGNVTIFRTAQFFVHAVSGRQRSASQGPAGGTSLLEQVRWISTERQRALQSETRLLPNTAFINPLLQREILIPAWLEAIVVLILLSVAMFVHASGLFALPLYQQDEGLLISNAWAVTQGLLQPYAYTYNQTFLGWIQLAGWLNITGGVTTFGTAIDSGRLFMLILSAGSAIFVYGITNRISGSRSAGLLAMVLFVLSPLGISYQREVLLDNIGIFWLLLSLYLIVTSNSRLSRMLLAGIVLGIAILSKEIFIIFIPVMLYAVWIHATIFQRKFTMLVFTYIVFAIVSFFVLLAVLKGELFPTGVLPWDHHLHPSLWEGLITSVQTARQGSDFLATWNVWMQSEQPLFIISTIAVGINLFAGWRNPLQTLSALLLVSVWAFILFTGIVSTTYLVILLPLMALNVAVAFNAFIKWPSKRFGFDLVRVFIIFAIIGLLTPYRAQSAQALTIQNANGARVSTLNWVRGNVPANATIILDSDLYADLHGGGKAYQHAQIYWNVVLDPAVRFNDLHNDWKNIDYIILDAQMQQDIRTRTGDMLLLDRALHHATLLQTFVASNNDPNATVQVYQVIHT